MNKGLYIHVPFCRQKCIYCDFYSLAENDHVVTESYKEAVIRNIKNCGYIFDTVYFGGGTPSLLSPTQVYDILSSADIAPGAEISMEANPETVTDDTLSGYRDAGVNRLSFGVQSFDDKELKMLGRIHSAETARNAVLSAHRFFDDISVDLMLGLPFSDADSALASAEAAVSLPITHISAYMLKIEEGTPLSKRVDLINATDDDRSAEQYEKIVPCLAENGFHQYEISNFCKPGHECRHNLKYWRCEEYLGVGPAAHSCIDRKRYCVPSDTARFISSEKQDIVYTDEDACTEEERFMLAMRLNEGYTADDRLLSAADVYIKSGFLELHGRNISFTVKGMLVSNSIIAGLSDVIGGKDENRNCDT